MSLPLVLSTTGLTAMDDGRPASPFVPPTKRTREFSDEQDFDRSTTRNMRRKQLKIEIPPTSFNFAPRHSARSATTTTKESPSSLFSAASEVKSPFDGVSLNADRSMPQSRLATTSASATSPLIRSPDSVDNMDGLQNFRPALLTAPPIPGLYFTPSLSLPSEIAKVVIGFCFKTYFHNPTTNQVMLFGRAPNLGDPAIYQGTASNRTVIDDNPPSGSLHSQSVSTCQTNDDCTSNPNGNTTGLPTILSDLLSVLSTHLKPLLPEKTYTLLFPPTPTQARQAIINLYSPGEGISPHVDLLKRYGDGIIGVSFGSGCVMRFDRVNKGSSNDAGVPLANGSDNTSSAQYANADKDDGAPSIEAAAVVKRRDKWELYLPERSVLVLTEEARYDWTHGIDKRARDYVALSELAGDGEGEGNETGRWIERGVRLSVTFRWLLPGADVVGPSPS